MSTSTSFTEIPRIDLSLASDPATEPVLLDQLGDALINVGFLYVVNHGVPERTTSNIIEALPKLFALPAEAKDEISLRNSPHFLGYGGDGSETTAGKSDRREQVEFATELKDGWKEGSPLSERLRGPNQWPSAYPELRPFVEDYISELTLLGERFLRLVAKALSLPPETLLPFLSDQHRLKLVHYPTLPENAAGSQGVGPHKDSSGWWTFLLQASPPHVNGLQALNKNGDWIDVPVLPGSFVVNIGQAFEVVTNGACKATTHRVLSGSLERFSVPFFQGVRRDLTKQEAVGTLRDHFEKPRIRGPAPESEEGREIDSAFLKGKYDTWGENQLRTKIRSHRDVGRKFYGHVFDNLVVILGLDPFQNSLLRDLAPRLLGFVHACSTLALTHAPAVIPANSELAFVHYLMSRRLKRARVQAEREGLAVLDDVVDRDMSKNRSDDEEST